MADNIIPLDPNNFSSETYSASDEALLNPIVENNTFDVDTDYVEYFVFDLNNNQVYPGGNDATFEGYSILDNEIFVDPVEDTKNVGIDTGIVNTLYNFYRRHLNSSPQETYYIKEISSNRTEIRLDSNIIDKAAIASSVAEFIAYREQDENFPDFYLNFGSNLLLIANNILLDADGTVLIKLYEPLPSNIALKTSLWVVEKISEGLANRIEFEALPFLRPQGIQLKGANFNLGEKDRLNNSTESTSLSGFTSPNSQSEAQINSFFENPGININVDYTSFENFVNFSSAEARLNNFYYKIELIQSASGELTTLNTLPDNTATSASKATLNTLINDTITNFDGYEYYLYFESGSNSWPKTNSSAPYENANTGSAAAQSWITSSLTTATTYDEDNINYLKFVIPDYIREDADNAQYVTFIDMVGHFFDNNVWIYLKDTTNKFDADNRIDFGVSKDLVAQVLRDFGINLYQNNFSTTDLYSAFLGFTPSGSLFPFPNVTGSLPTPSGFEYVDTFVSSSNEVVPLDDINKRIYKRLYHNLPYLLKSKGTVEGIKSLVSIYGIPDTILQVNEFGGKDRNNTNDWDLWKHVYNYQYQMAADSSIETAFELNSPWNSLNNRPSSVQFRFNAGLASAAPASQSLFSVDDGSAVKMVLEYDTTLPTTSGSYSGSIIDPEYQYADLKFTIDDFTTSGSIRLPFYNNDWWSVQINRISPNDFEFIAANKIYSGSDGSKIGFIGSASISFPDPSNWENGLEAHFATEDGGNLGAYTNFSGSYQEIRYYNQAISQSVFEDYVMNPQSFEGNGVGTSQDQLAFRAALGSELYSGSVSIHPKVSGSDIVGSFRDTSSTFNINEGSFITNREWVFLDSPAVGIKNRNTDKVREEQVIVPEGDTLSNIGSIQQTSFVSQSYTNNLNLLEVAISPQNQVNDDIIGQIGYFNIGDYIGDPRLISSSANDYPELVDLRDEYFTKYIKNYDVYDFIRLIKYFDNSLFKMVKDFTPARTSLASGIVIKPTILERQKYPTPQAEFTQPEYTASIGQTAVVVDGKRQYNATGEYESKPLEAITGSDGGAIITSSITQSWTGNHITPSGSVEFTQDDEREFINGEFSGSLVVATDGELNSLNLVKKPNTDNLVYDIDLVEGGFNQPVVLPIDLPGTGELYWFGEYGSPFKGSTPALVTGLYINEEDKAGTNIERALSNMSEGTNVSFRVRVRFNNVMPPPASRTFNTTLTGIVASVIGRGSNVWEIRFKDPIILGYIDFSVLSIDNTSLSDRVVAVDPLSFTEPFDYSDDNALLNNALVEQTSNTYLDVDYTQGQITPVNYEQILDGTATKATVQDYNFNLRRSIIPRYSGSVNEANTYNSGSGLNSQYSAGTYVAYYSKLDATHPGGSLYSASLVIEYLVSPDGQLIEAVNNDENRGLLKQNFVENLFAEGEVQAYAAPFDSTDTTPITLTQNLKVPDNTAKLIVEGERIGTAYQDDTNGGILYPAGIEFTSAKDLPSKAKELLAEKRII